MNERDTSQTQKEQIASPETGRYAAVEIHDFDADDTTQKVYLSPDTVGFVTGMGELLGDDNQPVRDSKGSVVLVGEVTILGPDGKPTTKRGLMGDILAIDTGIRAERQRQSTVGKNMAGVAFKSEQASFELVAPPEVLPSHPDDELGQTVARHDVLAQIASEQAAPSDQTDTIEVPREFVPEDSTARRDYVNHDENNRNVPYKKGIPPSAKHIVGSPYNPESDAIDAYGELLKKDNE
jgi:hypothetical protein